jgi:hypothetical protein
MKYVLVAPIWAIPKCLAKEGIAMEDVDLFEINEAFSGSTVAVMQGAGLDPQKTNVNGGSVALGHPIGASGCRVLVTLLTRCSAATPKPAWPPSAWAAAKPWRCWCSGKSDRMPDGMTIEWCADGRDEEPCHLFDR